MGRAALVASVLVLGVGAGLGACGEDDGGSVREVEGSESGSASGSGSGSASGTGSGSGLSEEDLQGAETEDAAILDAVEEYRRYVLDQVDELLDVSRTFTDAVRSGDLAAAQAAYAPSRVPWERIEPIAALVEDIDTAVDARVDDFEGTDDPEFTGWHRLELLLFERRTLDGAAPFADQLDEDLARLAEELPELDFPPLTVALGPGELIQEVAEGKITGEEDRYAGTDLWDFDANVDGSRQVIEILAPVLEERDADLLERITSGFDDVEETLATYERPGGAWAPYAELTDSDKGDLSADLAALAEDLALLAGTLDLE